MVTDTWARQWVGSDLKPFLERISDIWTEKQILQAWQIQMRVERAGSISASEFNCTTWNVFQYYNASVACAGNAAYSYYSLCWVRDDLIKMINQSYRSCLRDIPKYIIYEYI